MHSQVGGAQATSEGRIDRPKCFHISDRQQGASTVVKWALEMIPLFLFVLCSPQ